MATPAAAWTPRAGARERCLSPPASAPSRLSSSPGAGTGSPSGTARALCVRCGRPGTGARPAPRPRCPRLWLPQRPHPARSGHHPGAPAPPFAPAGPRSCAVLPKPRLTTCGCGWFPGAVTLLCRTPPAAGSPCDMPGAPPAEPAPPRVQLGPARRALPTGSAPPPASSRPAPAGPPARALRLPSRPAPAAAASPGSPTRGPSPPSLPPRVCPPPATPTPASFPPLPALPPHLGVPNPTPAAPFRWGPGLRGSHVAPPKPGREGEAPPPEETLGRVGVREAPRSLWGPFGRPRGTRGEKHKWVVWVGGFFPVPAVHLPAARPHLPPAQGTQRRGTF